MGESNSCNICDSKDSFSLGIISSNKNNRYLLCRPFCKETINVIEGTKKFFEDKPVFKDYDSYFKALRNKLSHLKINGKSAIRSDGKGFNFSLQRHNRCEVVNINKWRPLIRRKQFINYVLSRPDELEHQTCKNVNNEQLENMEKELEKVRKNVNSDDMINEDEMLGFSNVMPLLLVYENGSEYR